MHHFSLQSRAVEAIHELPHMHQLKLLAQNQTGAGLVE